MTKQITFYVSTNAQSPAYDFAYIGSFIRGDVVSENNYEQLGLTPVTFTEQPEGRVRAQATKVNDAWTGSWQTVTDWVLETEAKAQQVRRQRDNRLAASDWTQVSDAPVDKQAWATYRQALRDVSDQTGFPDQVTWPQPPAN